MRRLGRSAIEVSAMGMGCWAIGGPWWDMMRGGQPAGWGQVDDEESIRAIHRALDLGVTFFDTSDNYGCGHSERVLGQALVGRRDRVVISTKFGYVCDERTRQMTGSDARPEYIRRACEASLRRLNTDHIDLYHFHIYDYDVERAHEVREVLEDLVAQGKIRSYGWSTNDPARARVFAHGPACATVQHHFNVLEGNAALLTLCEEFDLASVSRGPLSMGLLTGKFSRRSKLAADDVRHDWDLSDGEEAALLSQLEAIRQVLTRDGRTLAQAALGWLWARSDRIIPIPGFKTVRQVEENVEAMRWGPLADEQMREVEDILARS
jgi:aryl-alcohol dehydrogenase-like predicted oxidoreductase